MKEEIKIQLRLDLCIQKVCGTEVEEAAGRKTAKEVN